MSIGASAAEKRLLEPIHLTCSPTSNIEAFWRRMGPHLLRLAKQDSSIMQELLEGGVRLGVFRLLTTSAPEFPPVPLEPFGEDRTAASMAAYHQELLQFNALKARYLRDVKKFDRAEAAAEERYQKAISLNLLLYSELVQFISPESTHRLAYFRGYSGLAPQEYGPVATDDEVHETPAHEVQATPIRGIPQPRRTSTGLYTTRTPGLTLTTSEAAAYVQVRDQQDGSGLVQLINESHLMTVSDLMSESSIRFAALDREIQKETMPIDSHLFNFRQRLQDLADVNVPVPDLLAIRKFGMSLNSKYKPVYIDLLSRGECKSVFDDFIDQLYVLIRAKDQAAPELARGGQRSARDHGVINFAGGELAAGSDPPALTRALPHVRKGKRGKDRGGSGKHGKHGKGGKSSKQAKYHCDICHSRGKARFDHTPNPQYCPELKRLFREYKETGSAQGTAHAVELDPPSGLAYTLQMDFSSASGLDFEHTEFPSDTTGSVFMALEDSSTSGHGRNLRVIMDSGAARVNISPPGDHLINVRPANPPGSVIVMGARVPVLVVADFPPFGGLAVVSVAPGVLFSLSLMRDRGWHITYNDRRDFFMMIKSGAGKFVFPRQPDGLYSFDLTNFTAGPPPPLALTVSNSFLSDRWTARERKEAEQARDFHEAMHHANYEYLATAVDAGTYPGIPLTGRALRNTEKILGPCPACLMGKMTEAPAPTSMSPHAPPGELLHADILFLMGKGGKKMPYLSTQDDATNFTVLVPLDDRKTDTVIRAFTAVVSTYKSYRLRVSFIRSDREGAFIAMEPALNQLAVSLQRTATNRHSRRAERFIRTMKNLFRSVLASLPFRLPLAFYGHLLADIVSYLNLTPNKLTMPRTPHERITGVRRKLTPTMLIPFGAIAVCKVPTDRLPSEQSRGVFSLVVGHDGPNSLVLWPLHSNRTFVSGVCQIIRPTDSLIANINQLADEDPVVPNDSILTLSTDDLTPLAAILPDHVLRHYLTDPREEDITAPPSALVPPSGVSLLPSSQPVVPSAATRVQDPAPGDSTLLPSASQDFSPADGDTTITTSEPGDASDPPSQVQPILSAPPESSAPADESGSLDPVPPVTEAGTTEPRRSMRVRRKVVRLVETIDPSQKSYWLDGYAYGANFNVDSNKLREKYGSKPLEEAVLIEFKSVFDTFGALKPLARDATIEGQMLPLHLVFDEKFDSSGNFVKLKNRIVIGGNWFDKPPDFLIASSTVRSSTIFLALNVCAKLRLKITVWDIKSAYLHAKVLSSVGGILPKRHKDLVLKVYPQWTQYVRDDGTIHFRVEKALYGLPEAARLWYLHLTKLLKQWGLTQSTTDKAMFHRRQGRSLLIVLIHVDDMLVACNDETLRGDLQTYLGDNLAGLTVQDGDTVSFLSMTIEQHQNRIMVSRLGYIDKLLVEFKVEKEYNVPCFSGMFDSLKGSKRLPDHSLSRVIMALNFLTDVRPDLKFVCTFLTWFMSEPTEALEKISRRTLGYLKKTRDRKMVFSPSNLQIRGAADAGYLIGQRPTPPAPGGGPSWFSTFGLQVKVGDGPNACVYCKAGRIKPVVRSSTEAEIYALNELATEIVFAVSIMEDLGFPQDVVILEEDNQPAIELLNNPDKNFAERSKHIAVRADYVRGQLENKKMRLLHVPTDQMTADYLTKPTYGLVFLGAAARVLNDMP